MYSNNIYMSSKVSSSKPKQPITPRIFSDMLKSNKEVTSLKTELSNKDDILCSNGNVCNPLPENFEEWKTEYNKDLHNSDNVKTMCTQYMTLNGQNGQNNLQKCAIDLNIGTCQSK